MSLEYPQASCYCFITHLTGNFVDSVFFFITDLFWEIVPYFGTVK